MPVAGRRRQVQRHSRTGLAGLLRRRALEEQVLVLQSGQLAAPAAASMGGFQDAEVARVRAGTLVGLRCAEPHIVRPSSSKTRGRELAPRRALQASQLEASQHASNNCRCSIQADRARAHVLELEGYDTVP